MMMQTLLFPNGGIRSSAAVFRPALLGFGHAVAVHAKEITDVHLHYTSQRGRFQLFISSIRSEGNRRGRPRRNASSHKISKEADKLKEPPTANEEASESSSQVEIIALFKRIQSSISKDRPTALRRSAKSQQEKKVKTPKFPRREQARGGPRDVDAPLSERNELLEGEPTNHTAFLGNTKVTRPASNFMKRSPIPPAPLAQHNNKDIGDEQPQSIPSAKVAEEQLQEVTQDRVDPDLQNLDELKLPDLKELAKRKGIKGYSKLKKGELLELLKGLPESI
ncbi:SAP-like protein BP-73 [Canna indica]|uniref:SAP-like protein BP-73 n=1 Tax=Canna indica TaxID=4628 RepID=A0AAQ3QKG2_9LILI|nr:SAP-like protein BP-73 [Canna indica]